MNQETSAANHHRLRTWARRVEGRIAVLIVVLAAAMAILGVAISALMTSRVLNDSLKDQVRPVASSKPASARALIAPLPQGSIAVLNRGGTVSTATNDHKPLSQADRAALSRWLMRRHAEENLRLPDRHDTFVVRGEHGTSEFVVGVSTEATERDVQKLVMLETLAWLGLSALAAGVGIVVSRRIARPVRVSAAAATRIAQTPVDSVTAALSQRLTSDPRAATEVQELVTSVNAMLAQLEVALRQRDESEATLRDFLADVSHDLRTPLAVIRAHAELTRGRLDGENGDDRDALRASLGHIESESARMGLMVDDLLTLARAEDEVARRRNGAEGDALGDAQTCDLTLTAMDIMVGASMLSSGQSWDIHTDDEPVVGCVPQPVAHRVITNLVTNARMHTPDGTAIRVLVSRRADTAVVQVTDDGPGLLNGIGNMRGTRFLKGRRTDSSGTGLGLAIVDALVRGSGGTFDLVSDANGTTATISWPAPPSGLAGDGQA